MIAWNCQGAGSVAFRNHAYELHRRHRPKILIIVEPRIAEERAQVVINTLPTLTLSEWTPPVSLVAFGCYGTKVPPTRWKFSRIVRIVSMCLYMYPLPPYLFYLLLYMLRLTFINISFFGITYKILLHLLPCLGSYWGTLMICFLRMKKWGAFL